jgi:hypothetical protein
MAATLQLNCWVDGDDISKVFSVEIEANKPVSALRDAIKGKKQVALAHVDADFLALRKVSFPVDRHLHQRLANIDVTDETSLSSVDDLVDVFVDVPPRKHLHIVVKPRAGESSSLHILCHALIAIHSVPPPNSPSGHSMVWTIN